MTKIRKLTLAYIEGLLNKQLTKDDVEKIIQEIKKLSTLKSRKIVNGLTYNIDNIKTAYDLSNEITYVLSRTNKQEVKIGAIDKSINDIVNYHNIMNEFIGISMKNVVDIEAVEV
jgi:hypothetical protein